MDGSWLNTPILWWHYILAVTILSVINITLRRVAQWAKDN